MIAPLLESWLWQLSSSTWCPVSIQPCSSHQSWICFMKFTLNSRAASFQKRMRIPSLPSIPRNSIGSSGSSSRWYACQYASSSVNDQRSPLRDSCGSSEKMPFRCLSSSSGIVR